MNELMVSCFKFDAWPDHEMSLLTRTEDEFDRFCSKHPGKDELFFAREALRRNPRLWIVGLARDPRDVVVSRHGKIKDRYWTDLKRVRTYINSFLKLMNHKRCVMVRYEDLVRDPDSVQREIMRSIPLLEKLSNFSDFETVSKPSKEAELAMRGKRPISAASIGRWRGELEHLKGQIERHGPLDEALLKLGYEIDPDWPEILETVAASQSLGFLEEKAATIDPVYALRLSLRRYRMILAFLLGRPRRYQGQLRYPED